MGIYEDIFVAFKKGDLSAFYHTLYPELLSYTVGILGEDYSFLAEDCVQDSIFKAYQQNQSFVTAIQWKVFLYTCIRNQAISMLRKGQAHRNYLTQIDLSEDDMSIRFIEEETLTLLRDAIEKLPPKYRAIVDLSFEEGLKNAEVAERLQIAEITVKKQKQRLMELLRAELEASMDNQSVELLLLLFFMSSER